jgi:hypothetical protein
MTCDPSELVIRPNFAYSISSALKAYVHAGTRVEQSADQPLVSAIAGMAIAGARPLRRRKWPPAPRSSWGAPVAEASVVMPAKAGIQYSVTLELNISGPAYWIIRFRG